MSVDLPPAISNMDEVTPMEVTNNEKVAIDGMYCVDHISLDLIFLIV